MAFLLLLASALFSSIDLPFVLENHPTQQKHLIETMPGGVAVFDYDNDGRTDIFFTNGAAIPSLNKDSEKYSNRLFRNEGDMKFSDVTAKAGVAGEGYSMGAAVADFDNDGDVDLFVAGVFRNLLYRNRGDGTFEEIAAKAGIASRVWSVAGAWLDYDNDGLLDLFIVNYAQWTPEFDRFCGDQAKGIRVYCHPRLFEGLPNTLYRNRGDGTFEDVSQRTGIAQHVGRGMSVATADYDLDGYMDVFVTNDKLPNFLFRNIGGKKFEETALMAGVALPADGKAISSMGADFRDYDNDGLPDIHVTALNNETFPLFRNGGKGEFSDTTYAVGLGVTAKYSGWSNGLYDFDNDGWKDIFTANSHVNDRIEEFEPSAYRQPNTLFRNERGRFTAATFGAPQAYRGGAVADLDEDGKLDIVTSALGAPAVVWRNVMPGTGQWLRVRLKGSRSNRDGIGAVLKVAGHTNHMTTAVGYASSSHIGVYFGLGDRTEVDVEVKWPSGQVQNVKGVKAGRVIEITEPSATPGSAPAAP